jgi:hypothetical protein
VYDIDKKPIIEFFYTSPGGKRRIMRDFYGALLALCTCLFLVVCFCFVILGYILLIVRVGILLLSSYIMPKKLGQR